MEKGLGIRDPVSDGGATIGTSSSITVAVLALAISAALAVGGAFWQLSAHADDLKAVEAKQEEAAKVDSGHDLRIQRVEDALVGQKATMEKMDAKLDRLLSRETRPTGGRGR